jgi:hypothetical protein
MARQIVVEIIGDASKFDSSVKESTRHATKFGVDLGGVGKAGAVAGIGIGIGAKAFGALDAAIGGIGNFLNDSAKEFNANQVSVTKLTTALKNNVPGWNGNIAAIEDYISAQAKLGFTDDDIRDSLGQLVGITGDVTEATKLNTLAQDLARSKGIDLATAVDIVTKAHEGNGKVLKGLGIDIEGVTTGAGFLDAIQRNVTGSAADWAATNEGTLAVSQVKVGEAMEKVGSIVSQLTTAVMPALADVMTWIVDNVVPAFQSAFDWIATNVMPGVRKAIEFITDDVLPALGAAFGWIAKNILPTVNDALNWIVTNVLPPLRKAIEFYVTNVLPALGAAFGWIVTNVLPPVKTALNWIATNVLPPLGEAFGFITTKVLPAIGTAFNWVVTNVLPPVVSAIKFVTDTVLPALSKAFTGIQKTVTTVFGVVATIIKSTFNAVIGIVNGMISAINSIQVHIGRIGMDTPMGWMGVGPFDWNGVGLHHLPYLHSGGIVPGQVGSDVLAILQAGERVLPVGSGFSGNVTININGAQDVSGIMAALRRELTRQGMSFA